MQVVDLFCEGFRNLEPCEIAADPGVNVIYGDNAQGKTNLIEAVWLFTGGKSFRGSKEGELPAFGRENAKIRLRFFGEDRMQEAELHLGQKREFILNGVEKKQASELAGAFHAVVFSPLHLKLVENGPEIRRKFMDAAISQIYPKYIDLQRRYYRAVQQRNSALRDAKFHPEIFDLISIFENSIAGLGGRIIRYRLRYLHTLCKYAPEIYAGIAGGKENLQISYQSKAEICSEDERQNAAALLEALSRSRENDMQTGATSVGPHRDDMDILINTRPVRAFGSQGQKRSAVLALKLAEAEVLRETTGEQPVALLDDVMSELDLSRQEYILNHIGGWQVFITCCDPGPVETLAKGKVFHMENGRISER